jgi:hypothetical protein
VTLALSDSGVSTKFFQNVVATLALQTASVATNQTGVFAGSFAAPPQIGMFPLEYRLNRACGTSD